MTFLFTDIVGSTRAWEQHPDAMAVALADHNALLRGVFKRHHGQVFKTVGDSFCCAFAATSDAVAASVEGQRRLRAHAWPSEVGEIRVRMAIHAGAAAMHDGDYFGPAVNRVARLVSITHGGQILLSSSAAAAVAAIPVGDLSLRDLGAHRLKDLKQAETTYQVVADGLYSDFPALTSLDAHPNNLPSQMSSFVGRVEELASIRRCLEEFRVVTIAGPGGIGKTRLALQIAAEEIQTFTGGVYFIALAPIAKGSLVVHALASALGVSELPNEALEATIARYIDRKRMLLVFDNSEHVLADTAAIVKSILTECPNARCLVTGREPLHLVGERVERLAPLSTPENAGSLAELEARDGTRLFLERARAVAGGGLTLSVADCNLVAGICRRLDGIPLAVELAASRLATMPLPQLAERLNVSVLVNKDPTANQRHRTLRAAIEWSYKLLANREQLVFMGLGVFQGGCAIEALARVVDAAVDDELESLVDKSLAQLYVGENGAARYRLLEPIGEFAALELDAAGLSKSFWDRHLAYYHALATAAARAEEGKTRRTQFELLDGEIGNIRAALEWAAKNNTEEAGSLASDLGMYWRARGNFTEGRAAFERALSPAAQLPAKLRANLLRQSAGLAAMQDDYEQSKELAQSALGIYRELGDDAGIGLALHTLAEVAHRQGHLDEAERLYGEALPHLDAGNHLLAKTICLMNQGMIARQKGDLVLADAMLRRAESDADVLRDRDVWAQVKVESAWATLFGGNPDAAEQAFREALAANVADRNLHGVCQARLGIAAAALAASRIELAWDEYKTALREANGLRARIFVVDAIYGVAAIRALRGELMDAAKCCALASRLAAEVKCEPRSGAAYVIATERPRAGLSAEELALAASAAEEMRVEDVAVT